MKMSARIVVGFLFMVLISQAAFAAGDYSVGPGDVLEISVWRDESLIRKVVVPPDGVISFPLIGDINANGMTIADIRKSVTQKLKEYVQDSVVTVMLLEINSMNAYVIGKVKTPGGFQILMDTNVMQMLSMAGGLTPFASEKNIHILRKEKNTTVKIPFNYSEVLKGENLGQNIVLQRGDVVVVP